MNILGYPIEPETMLVLFSLVVNLIALLLFVNPGKQSKRKRKPKSSFIELN